MPRFRPLIALCAVRPGRRLLARPGSSSTPAAVERRPKRVRAARHHLVASWRSARTGSSSRSRRRQQLAGRRPGSDGERRVHAGRRPRHGRRRPTGTFVWTIEDVSGHLRRRPSTSRRPATWGAEFTTAAAGTPAETDRLPVRGPRQEARRSCRATRRRRVDTPTLATSVATSRRSRPTRSRTRRSTRRRSPTALAAHKPFVLVFATPKFCTARSAARRSTRSSRSPPPTRT